MLKKLTLICLLAALTLAACSAAATPAPSDSPLMSREFEGGGAAPPAEAPAFASDSTVAQQATSGDRLVIKNASLVLVVADTQASLQAINALTSGLDGFVVSSNTYQTTTDAQGNKVLQGTISIRVPAERFSEALAQLRNLAVEVDNENITGEDVTAQYTDLQSQLKNLEAAEAQLQTIMQEAKKTEDVLNVFNQLTSIRGQIEQVKGQMKYYSESAAMSLINVSLVPDALSQPIEIGGWRPEGVAREAIEALVRALQGLATAGIWLGVFFLPLALLIFGPLFLLGRWALRRVRRPKPMTAPNLPSA